MADPRDLVDVAALARSGDLRGIQAELARHSVPVIVDELERHDRLTGAFAFRSLPKQVALAVFEDFVPALQTELIAGLRADATADLVADLDPDDRAGLLPELPATVAHRLLSGLNAQERAKTTALLGYPVDSAGRRDGG